MAEKKRARRGCDHDRADKRPERDANIIPQDYERGTLAAGLLMALTVGVPMLVQAVV